MLEIETENRYDVYEIRSIHWDLDYYCYRSCVWFAYHQVRTIAAMSLRTVVWGLIVMFAYRKIIRQ